MVLEQIRTRTGNLDVAVCRNALHISIWDCHVERSIDAQLTRFTRRCGYAADGVCCRITRHGSFSFIANAFFSRVIATYRYYDVLLRYTTAINKTRDYSSWTEKPRLGRIPRLRPRRKIEIRRVNGASNGQEISAKVLSSLFHRSVVTTWTSSIAEWIFNGTTTGDRPQVGIGVPLNYETATCTDSARVESYVCVSIVRINCASH